MAMAYVSGVARSVRAGTLITVAKLVPLLGWSRSVAYRLTIIDGAVFAPAAWSEATVPSRANFSSAVLLLTFAFDGWETALVAAGGSRDPTRDMPFALLVGLALSTRPLADAATVLVGPVGGTVIDGRDRGA